MAEVKAFFAATSGFSLDEVLASSSGGPAELLGRPVC